jgi:uncharacterized membrane protein
MNPGEIATETLPEPTRDESAYAGLAHALMMATWWIGPLVIYLIKKESRFVRFHALKALVWQLIFTGIYLFGMIVVVVSIVATSFQSQSGPQAHPQLFMGVFIVLGCYWLLIMSALAITLTLSILFALKAMRGEWADYPVIGRWARHLARI